MGSVYGSYSLAWSGPYCASKHPIEGLCGALRQELRLFSIPVIVLRPGGCRLPRSTVVAIRHVVIGVAKGWRCSARRILTSAPQSRVHITTAVATYFAAMHAMRPRAGTPWVGQLPLLLLLL